jgi:DNA-binding transcriptional MerR regulator
MMLPFLASLSEMVRYGQEPLDSDINVRVYDRPEGETGMHVGELAKRTGASIRSLHYYEQMGVLQAMRQENGYRSYPPEAIEQVQRIRGLLHLGFTLADIQLLTPCLKQTEQGTPLCAVAIQRYQQKLAELDERIQMLQELRERVANHLTIISPAQGKEHIDDYRQSCPRNSAS